MNTQKIYDMLNDLQRLKKIRKRLLENGFYGLRNKRRHLEKLKNELNKETIAKRLSNKRKEQMKQEIEIVEKTYELQERIAMLLINEIEKIISEIERKYSEVKR